MRLHEIFNNPQTLLEYNKQATLKNWGKRIAQAATFNEQNMQDNWFYSNERNVNTEEELAREVIAEFERMDPTQNKQYVMTLVRWYTGNIKRDAEIQKEYSDWRRHQIDYTSSEYDHPDGYPEDYKNIQDQADEFDDFEEDFGNYLLNPENLDTFNLEDAEQIKTALTRYHSMKPQLQPNERDIGRFKTFYRFEDFVDAKLDPEVKQEIDNKTLNRSDVEVLYNGPLGTVTIPRSHEASCELGSGTKWCTATTNDDRWFKNYSKRNDLIIYNEKPGNAKYQFHVSIHDIEARDARDRSLPYSQLVQFTKEHPVMSKILKDSRLKAVEYLAKTSWDKSPDGSFGITDMQQTVIFNELLDFNKKRGGGVMPFLDGYYTSRMSTYGLANAKNLPIQKYAKRLVKYALQRKKSWPQMEKLIIDLFQKTLPKINFSNNTHLKKLENFTKIMDIYADALNPQWKEYNDIKTQLVAGIKNASTPYTQQQITDESFLREFSESVESEELVWHRDRCDRLVKVIEGKGWKFQLDNKLPVEIKAGDTITIPAKTYHRIHKGTSKLVVEIKEYR